jgi:hypothetical protein
MIKRILRKYKYPPEKQEAEGQLVLKLGMTNGICRMAMERGRKLALFSAYMWVA